MPRPYLSKLFTSLYLHNFRWVIPRDENRAADGIELRHQYMSTRNIQAFTITELQQPCSVLEMMVALAKRCDFQTMTNFDDDQSWIWFDGMLMSLGLLDMDNSVFDENIVNDILERWMSRKHSPDGQGGLFYIPGFTEDMRKMEIWYQMCSFVNNELDLSI